MKLIKKLISDYKDYELETCKSFDYPGDCFKIYDEFSAAYFSHGFVTIWGTKYRMNDITSKISNVTIDNGWKFENTINIPKKVLDQLIDIMIHHDNTYLQFQNYANSSANNLISNSPLNMELSEDNDLHYKNYKIAYNYGYHGDCIHISDKDIAITFTYGLMKFKSYHYDMADITSKIPGVSMGDKDAWVFDEIINIANVVDQLVDIVDHCKSLYLQLVDYIANAFASNTKSARSAQ